ncbi:MAG: glycosyltransferase family 4 protein, partial [Anaerolineales bacterium]
TLVTFVRASDSPAAIRHLEGIVSRLVTSPMPRSRRQTAAALVRSLVKGEPVLIARDRVAAMFARLRGLMMENEFDVIHADQLWMAPYARAAANALPPGRARPRLVLDQHNAVHLIPRRLMAGARNPVLRLGWQREAAQMARYEKETCQAFDRVITVTEEDAQALVGLYPAGQAPRFSVIPICIDPAAAWQPAEQSQAPDVLFMGGMHWPPNADGVSWFAAEILPAIVANQPQARLLAVGRQPPESLRQGLARVYVEAPGYVDDPQPYWTRSRVFVVPLRAGGGMRVKILDAWARGVPVVSTSIGAEGLQYHAGSDLLIADTPADFAAAVLAVLQDTPLAQRLAAAGRATVEQHYDWRCIYPAWEKIYDDR